ncbi:endolytic transglycosylase MltG [Polluticaenibacter yanchengensis]|uniref:Endolytic murein transglycosylase n=1 Tax=Polluticaenibacter yanchengensis TaxID=3014562 RepID=A0ABT4UHA5_9BACT|nr:endolytic transglycosylase MltG [Chitinophagaceae bacterium LY-5]
MLLKIFKLVVLLLLVGAVTVWFLFFKSNTQFAGNQKAFYIHSGTPTATEVLASLEKDSILSNTGSFKLAADRIGYWKNIKPGRYVIKRNMSVLDVLRKLKNGQQDPVNFTIVKIRVPEDLAKMAGRKFEPDSLAFVEYLEKDITRAYKIIPDTYSLLWTNSPEKTITRLNEEYEEWWAKNDRKVKAKSLGYSAFEIMTIASIVEEETNRQEDKGKIASVYMNRLKINMPLQADPTVRFSKRDFKAHRVYFKDLKTQSDYNTYLNRGLPPTPICTPSQATIDAVLDAPKTDYIYFVAHPDLTGGSVFNKDYSQHQKDAKIYQDSLTAWLKRKAEKEPVKDSGNTQ